MKKILKRILVLLNINPEKVKQLFFGFESYFDESALIIEFFAKQSKIGVAIDVGVAMGSVSRPLLDNGWLVFGFEPDQDNRKVVAIKQLLKYPNFKCSSQAVSNKSGEKLDFYTSDESMGISSLHNFKNHKLSHQVTTVTLADFLAEQALEKINFLKIDTEGHDLFVLQGFPFEQHLPEVIVIEFDDFKTKPLGYDYKDIGDLLIDKGYCVYLSEWHPIKQYGTRHKFRRLVRYPNTLINSKDWGNFIAIKPELLDQFEGFISRHQVIKYYKRCLHK